METKDVEQAVAEVRRHFDHDAAKQILKEKYEAKMLFAAFGGMWKANPALLGFLHLWHGVNDPETVLVDEYGNPCKVNVPELFLQARERYQEQMNAWHAEYEELQKQR